MISCRLLLMWFVQNNLLLVVATFVEVNILLHRTV